MSYKYISSPFENNRAAVPPAPGQVSRAFASNGAWLLRDLDCTCSVQGKEIAVAISGDHFSKASYEGLSQHQELDCALQEQLLAHGLCRLFLLQSRS
jgi:hypothetical protein